MASHHPNEERITSFSIDLEIREKMLQYVLEFGSFQNNARRYEYGEEGNTLYVLRTQGNALVLWPRAGSPGNPNHFFATITYRGIVDFSGYEAQGDEVRAAVQLLIEKLS